MKSLKLILIAMLFSTGCAHGVIYQLSFSAVPTLSGNCNHSFPIKGNDGNYGFIYHTHESPYYDRVLAEQCFADEATARKLGYRRYKHP